jgi:plastocyanin
MLLNTGALLVASFLATALAASFSTTASSAPSSTSSTAIATHTIIVGEDGLHYTPDEVFANVGDIIEYRFFPQNHSVARSSFGPQPCIPYEYTAGIGAVGFWSGFRPVAAVLSDVRPLCRYQTKTYKIAINSHPSSAYESTIQNPYFSIAALLGLVLIMG